jgi:uncharacterized protein YjbJ (UPF0337 family)
MGQEAAQPYPGALPPLPNARDGRERDAYKERQNGGAPALAAGLQCSPAGDTHMPNKDEVAGKVDQIKGRVKQAVGKATDDPELHDEGVVDEAGGELREGAGTVRRKVGEAVKDLGNAIKR